MPIYSIGHDFMVFEDIIMVSLIYLGKACFTLNVRPFVRAFLAWVTERRGRETDRRQFYTESHLT